MLLHAIIDLFKLVIGYKNLHFRVSKKISFTYKTLIYTDSRSFYNLIIGFYLISSNYSIQEH